ncbi:MAG: ATP-binding protein [Bacteroidales bacterium]|nr:ATP-binding protein [Bacteroidales bacterium]
MNGYIQRIKEEEILDNLAHFPAVAILGPRQCGKSTLAKHLLKGRKDTIYLDLENPSDRQKLSEPELFFSMYPDKLLCLDEIQRVPELFPLLRSLIDKNERNSQFLILGSASRDLLRQSSESLAGRIVFVELTPLLLKELSDEDLADFWLKGGFPRSYLVRDEAISFRWRLSFISTFLERDLVSLGFNIPPLTMHRLWKMCANQHGQLINLSQFGGSLGISHTTVRKYLDLLKETFMVRILLPVDTNMNKRLIKAPKIYLRDNGILHALLNIHTKNELLGHPIMGASWEGLVIEQMISLFGEEDSGFYRTAGGAELDLVVRRGNRKIAIECKASLAPRLERGFYQAMDDLQIDEAWVISPVDNSYPLKNNVRVMPLGEAMDEGR